MKRKRSIKIKVNNLKPGMKTARDIENDSNGIFIPAKTGLNKSVNFSPEEFEEMKKHTIYGYEMLKDVNEIPAAVKKAVITHHEHFNGEGYPLT